MAHHYDVVVIGTGQAGPSLAVRFANAGLHVAIVERDKFGGTCVNNGCTPTKTLVASAYAAHLARRAREYGVDTGPVSVDMKRVKAAQGPDLGTLKPGRGTVAAQQSRHHRLPGARPVRRDRTPSRSETTSWKATASSSTSVAARWSRRCRAWTARPI